MKTLLLFMTSLLLSITTISASDIKPKKKEVHKELTKQYRFVQPIVFVERGIEFSLFPDGSFDFEIQRKLYNNYSNSRRTTVNAVYATRGVQVKYTSNRFREPMVFKDRFGKIIQIESTPIYYDRMGHVTRIGSVDIDYNRGTRLISKVGGLRVNYNHWGQIVNIKGYVNPLNRHLNSYYAANNDMFYDNDYDDSYFYYKKGHELKKFKKNRH
ncbi:hypothetical protein [Yeosuana aromativorans]|nr:hypothetical protein [Yeosuana aromativorans]